MTEPDPTGITSGDAQVIHFVRNTLGCGCPDEVFEQIAVDPHATAFDGLPVDYVIDIGGRLLVAVCVPARWRQLQQALANILRRGREYRDRQGFNRLRLVVAVQEPGLARPALAAAFETAAAGDGRLHLHVLAPSALPDPGSATMSKAD